jgi:hypothetical protein
MKKNIPKKTKKSLKEQYKKELEDKLIIDLEELKDKRFNLVKNDPFFVPDDKEEVMKFIKKANNIFDKEAVKNVIKKYPDDEDIVIASIFLFNHSIFPHVSLRLQNDRNFILKMVDHNVNILEYADKKFTDDDEIMYKAIDVSGYIIRVASERLRHDKPFCLAAIKSQADAYSVIPKKMQKDNELLFEAMKERGEFLMYSPEVKTNKELLIKAFSNSFPPQSRNLLSLTSDEFRNDKEVALAAIKCNPDNLWGISNTLREEIGDSDPIEYLTQSQLNSSIQQSQEHKSKNKFKK